MIVRLWRGRVRSHDAVEYLALMRAVALPDYRAVPGNHGAWCLHRSDGRFTEVSMLTLWQDLDAIRRFAGDPVTAAKYYDFDPAFLVEMPAHAEHYEVIEAGQPTGVELHGGAGPAAAETP